MSKAALDVFGQVLMSAVRDESILHWRKVFDGRMKDEESVQLHSCLAEMSAEDRRLAASLVPRIVDTVLHYLLSMLEQDQRLTLTVRAGGDVLTSIRDISDGLSGELYSSAGWIARFSQESDG